MKKYECYVSADYLKKLTKIADEQNEIEGFEIEFIEVYSYVASKLRKALEGYDYNPEDYPHDEKFDQPDESGSHDESDDHDEYWSW